MVTLWNPADEAQDFSFTVFFSGGHYQVPIHLEPRATHTFNVSEIIQGQVPDAEGNIIPATIDHGSAQISGSRGETERVLFAVSEGTYNVRKATCGGHCMTCDGVVSSFMVDSPFAVAIVSTERVHYAPDPNLRPFSRYSQCAPSTCHES
jgi:hypothetical protein